MFGLGYVGAEDRLFFMDVLRHAGRAELSALAGGANAGMDESVWADTPYTEADLQRQYDTRPAGISEKLFRQGRSDVENYVAGINQYIAEARARPEQDAGRVRGDRPAAGPDDWKVTDVISTASLVGGIFGKGGGGELTRRWSSRRRSQRFGKRGRTQVWRDFRERRGPRGADHRARSGRFPYQVPPAEAARASRCPTAAPCRPAEVVAGSSGSSRSAAGQPAPVSSSRSRQLLAQPDAGRRLQRAAGLGAGVRGRRADRRVRAAGRLLRAADPDGAGRPRARRSTPAAPRFPGSTSTCSSAAAATTPGARPRPARTSIDTFAVPLCEPGGGRPTLDSDGYRFRGRCRPFEVLTKTNSWTPNAADQTPPGSETLRTQRTKLGIVIARARVERASRSSTRSCARPTSTRSSRRSGSRCSTTRGRSHGPTRFQRAAHKINYTFNWFYVDRRHIAYFNSGWNPVRSPAHRPQLPGQLALRVARLQPGARLTADYTLRSRAGPQVDRPELPHELEQQAGPRLPRRRQPVELRVHLPLGDARRAGPAR